MQLEVENLVTAFLTESGEAQALNGISFSVDRGEIVGLVGESGCGKSVTSLSLMQLLDPQVGRIVSGRVLFDGVDLLKLSAKQIRQYRGNKISMIFQEPMTSLNPVFTIGNQIAEVFKVHQKISHSAAIKKAIEMLELVRIPAPEKRVHEYPHQLSGGMRQRVMIAMALACRPQLLIADEPTTALDVTIQAQILNILQDLKDKLGMSILFITHDLGIVAEFCDRVLVMYAGDIVEASTVQELFAMPQHPYTKGLLASIPRLDQKIEFLPSIEGSVPSLSSRLPGCGFADRCPHMLEKCRLEKPLPISFSKKHTVACHLFSN
ncbi:MAG: ABC transporter ATP-binding protein [Oligoflexales bacterium]|nr:ABC transporter ATP-binding protein [Oligoflexales bacterium]